MKTKVIGIVIVIIGILMIAYNSFNFKTTEKVVDLGAIKITQEKNNPIQWSPILGVVLLIGGIVIIVSSRKSEL
ncbi:hypothetical protein [Emticicia sp.]|uniref:hypothetical protein n=1 Tax=Emticicia sp. TaxID=1930953 RepID=UPI003750B8C8